MAEGREVSAWLNASKMSGCHYLFVEGVSDECFWKKFINRDVILIQQVNGWSNVVDCVRKFNNESLNNNCIGIIDRDFENFYAYKSITEDNIFLTDDHDIEMMMYHSDAYKSAIQSIDKSNKINTRIENILKDILYITDKIGYLKLCSQKDGLGLVFKKENRKTHDIELPNYQKIINNYGCYISDESLINQIIDFTKNNVINKRSISDKSNITNSFTNIQLSEYDSFQLSNGHDATYITPYILRRKYKLNGNHINKDTFGIALFAAYDIDYLKTTKLYQLMLQWVQKHKYNIFIS